MKTYVIAAETIKDKAMFDTYRKPATLMAGAREASMALILKRISKSALLP
jgi:hypothetical protein